MASKQVKSDAGQLGRTGSRTQRPVPRKPPSPPQRSGSSLGFGFSAAIAGIIAVAAGTWWASACSQSGPPGADTKRDSPARINSVPSGVQPAASNVLGAPESADAGTLAEPIADASPDGPWQGPFVIARVLTAPIYSTTSKTTDKLIGYLRSGGKAPVEGPPVAKPNCKEGWYQLVPHGFVCGRHVMPASDEAVAENQNPPDFEVIVPYKYAHNTKDGTPLYREIPSRQQMEQYEPYLTASSRAKAVDAASEEKTAVATRDHGRSADAGVTDAPTAGSHTRDLALDAGAPLAAAIDAALETDEPEPDLPWWQANPDAGRKPLTLRDMAEGADGILVKRMAHGFYVAVDRSFRRNERLWIKTTEGLYAPSDRMSINSPPVFHGVELGAAGQPELPVAFVMSEQAATYEPDDGGGMKKRKMKVKRFTAIALTGHTAEHGGVTYRETKDGYWVQDKHVTVAEAAQAPAGIGASEKWIDVNLSRQVLVAFEGTKPVYATLVSSGKKGTTKATDHSTVEGEFRIREKHVASTMDGDGAAPGEGPYSIQDVPYIMYFKGSYAIHGAFWHNNFGRRMSHGCVNLAPLDAKYVFRWSEPLVPQGWHGAWATEDRPGTRIFLHP